MLRASVIIPTLDRSQNLIDAVNDLKKQNTPDFEIIIVDQSDITDKAVVKLAEENNNIHYIHSNIKSSPHARNLGAKEAKNEILIFIDDDVSIKENDFINNHLANFDDKKVGLVGGRIIYKNEAPAHQEVGRLKFWGLKEITNFDSTVKTWIDHAPGGNMSVRKKVYWEVGGYSEIYKGNAHMEETDFSLKVKRFGYKLIFEPLAVLRHLQASTGGNRTEDIYQFRYWLVHNFVVFYLRNYPIILFPLCFLKEFFWAVFSALKRKDIKMFFNMYKAIMNGIKYNQTIKGLR